jgi:hypothetical protein
VAVATACAVAQPMSRPSASPAVSPAVADALAGGLACGAMDAMFVADVLKARAWAPAPPICARHKVRSPFEVDTPFPLQVRAQSGTPLFRGGARSLFAGAVPSALFRVANGVLYLPIYSSAKRGLHHGAALPEPRAVASAAAAAVTATALVELPLEAQLLRVKTG